jgi:hypothetical protein
MNFLEFYRLDACSIRAVAEDTFVSTDTHMEEHFMSETFSRYRERTVPPPGGAAQVNSWSYSIESTPNSKNWKKYNTVSQPITGWPFISTESCWDQTHPGPPWNSGGPFKKIKIDAVRPFGVQGSGSYITNSSGYVITPVGNGRIKYDGGFLPPGDWPGGFIPDDPVQIRDKSSSWYPDQGHLDTAAWDKTKPKIEQGGLFVAIAELKDVPKMFQTSARAFREAWEFSHSLFSHSAKTKRQLFMAPKKAADHFINHNFGWVPFVKDLSDFLSNLRDFREKIGILSQQNGQWIRRRSILENVDSDIQVPGWAGTGIHNVWPLTVSPVNDTWVGTPRWEYRTKTQTYSTAVGSFRYYIPYFDVYSPEWGGLGAVKRALALFGARVSPMHIYQAVPWSWLVDWLTPVGHDLQALQDAEMDQLVAKYLYTTTHSIRTIEFKQYVPFNAASGGPRTLTWSRSLESKQRKGIDSPYGFGLTWDSLSPKQIAILAALGITRT